MKLGNPINIRLSTESEVMYEAEAIARNLPLRTYLRQKLEDGEDIMEEISRLRLAVEQRLFSGSGGSGASSSRDFSFLLEMLLLLRQIAQPHRVQLAQEELKRLGFEVWEAKENDES